MSSVNIFCGVSLKTVPSAAPVVEPPCRVVPYKLPSLPKVKLPFGLFPFAPDDWLKSKTIEKTPCFVILENLA
jgi:hypothetical protein